MKLMNSRLKLLSGLKLSITEDAQDGRFSIIDSKIEIEVRVSLIPNNYGESFVMRLLDPRNIMANIESLGMSTKLYEIVERSIENQMVLYLQQVQQDQEKLQLYMLLSKTIHSWNKNNHNRRSY